MTIHLPDDLERFLHSEVQNGHFASEQEAIAEAVRLFRQRQPQTAPTSLPLSEEELERHLMQTGFLASRPAQHSGTTSRCDFQPVPIEGEPISETVIRERR